MITEDKKSDEMTTLLGGEEIEVTHLPLEALEESDLKRLEKFRPLLGTTERVKVRQIPVSLLRAFSFALDNEASAIELYCRREEGWADTLTPASADAVADKGQEINIPFFRAWFLRQAKWRETTKPGAIAELEATLRRAIENASRSPGSAAPAPTTTT